MHYISQKQWLFHNHNSVYLENVFVLPKYIHYFSVTMVILEVTHLDKTEENCLPPNKLNLNLVKFKERKCFTLFFSCFSSLWSELHHGLIVVICTSVVRKSNSFCFGKLVSTESGRKICIW